MTYNIRQAGALAMAGALVAWLPLQAQGVRGRVAQVRDGTVRLTFPLRPEVCGSGQSIWRNGSGGRSVQNWGDRYSRDVEYDVDCDAGPGRLVIDKDKGEIVDVRFYVGGRWRASAQATDLGAVGASDAAALLINIAETTEGKPAQRAIFPLTLVDSVVVWRDLIRIARNDSRSRSVRKDAVFWLSQLAEQPATAGLNDLVGDAAIDRDVREQAIFALSQRPRDEGVPALIQVVRSSKDKELRKKALFWLGQSGDPRALQLIEELLAKG
jgi:HEAT repeats